MTDPSYDGILMIGDYVLQFDPNELEDEFKEIARRELRETPEVKEDAVATLRELVRDVEDFNFPFANEEGDDILLRFLRPCKFYPQSALAMMKRYFLFSYNNPKLCRDLLCKEDLTVFEQEILNIIPARDQNSRCLVVFEIGSKWEPRKCTLTELIRGVVIMIQGALLSQHNQIAGGVLILDAKGLALRHVLQFTPSLALTILHYVQDCLPFRMKAIHIVNQAYFFNLAFAIFKPFLNRKMQKRIYFHGQDRESLLKHIDAKSLPAVYGGDLVYPHLSGSKIFDFFSYYKESFKSQESCGYTKKPKL